MAGGRPTKYDEKFHPKVVKYMVRCGMTDKEIAKDLGIAESTLHKWKLDKPGFSESLKENKYFVDSLVEDSLLKRAIGYKIEERKVTEGVDMRGNPANKVETTTKQVIPDTTAQIFWLKNRQPDQWRDKHNLEIDKLPPVSLDFKDIEKAMKSLEKRIKDKNEK